MLGSEFDLEFDLYVVEEPSQNDQKKERGVRGAGQCKVVIKMRNKGEKIPLVLNHILWTTHR